jgi:4-hydroxybenzoate polyprenyltransferase
VWILPCLSQSRDSVSELGIASALLGIGLVSSGTAALNEVMERDTDGRMARTAGRPLPAGRMRPLPATLIGSGLTLGGSLYLAWFANRLTGLLTLLTAVAYLAAYTPLKRVSSLCTFVGAFPGAMPGVLGWVAVRGSTGMGDSGPFRDSLPVAISPLLLGIAGHTYMVGAAVLGLGALFRDPAGATQDAPGQRDLPVPGASVVASDDCISASSLGAHDV